jgi:arginyl-tRNA synthetase
MFIEEIIAARLRPAFDQVAGGPADPAVRRSQHADFQADGALALARGMGRAPREVAAEVVARADLEGFADVEVVGPGFINITVQTPALRSLLTTLYADSRLGVPRVATPQTVLVDYSGPNVAKEMHVGHLRSTVIGDAIVRLLEFQGHVVTRVNHLGDWGTPFGMLIEHLVDVGEQEAAHELSVGDLTGFYQAARQKFDGDPDFKRRAQLRVVALQSGDETTRRLWRLLVDESEKYFLSVYSTLDVTLSAADFVGESAYNDELSDVVDELSAKGLLSESDGALCAFPPGFTGRDGTPMPVIVRKKDGGFNYSATDLAALRRRCRAYDRAVYVVGTPQKQHFAMVFAVGADAGWVRPGQVEHVAFGSILGPEGKMLKTRAGDSVKLSALLDEAVSRAASLAGSADVAHAVGIGAVKYADLSSDRVKDYVFAWDRALSLTGDSGAYLQYAYARIQSLLAKAPVWAPDFVVAEPAERALALELLGFPGAVAAAANALQPHRLAGYLHGLATAYSAFYESCPVLRSDVRDARLTLADLTGRVLALGLSLLGIRTPSRL